METKAPRFTGEWPTPELCQKYPNWEHALDEEGVPGQDETTLRPADVQDSITDDVAYTAAAVTFANGSESPALLELNDLRVCGVDLLLEGRGGRRLYVGADGRWIPFEQTWLPEAERMPSVALSDPSIFPMRVVSALRSTVTGKRYAFVIKQDGTAT